MLIDETGEIEDHWPLVPDHEALPAKGYALVPLARLGEAQVQSGLYLGVLLPNDGDLARLEGQTDRLGLIAIDFPGFADGRGFSIARRLRDRGYPGRLRAVGPVIADQFAALLACGFDEVQVPETVALRQPATAWLAERARLTAGYQRGRAGRVSILDQRASSVPTK